MTPLKRFKIIKTLIEAYDEQKVPLETDIENDTLKKIQNEQKAPEET